MQGESSVRRQAADPADDGGRPAAATPTAAALDDPAYVPLRRLRPGLTGHACLIGPTVAAWAIGLATISLTSDRTVRLGVATAVLAVTAGGPVLTFARFARAGRGPGRLRLTSHADRPAFAAPGRYVLGCTAMGLQAAFPTAIALTALVTPSRPGGHMFDTSLRCAVLALVLVNAVMVVYSTITLSRSGPLVLRPDGIVLRDSSAVVPWGSARDLHLGIPRWTIELAVRRPEPVGDEPPLEYHTVQVWDLNVPSTVLVAAVRRYVEHPELRAQIGTAAELARLGEPVVRGPR